MEMVGKKLEAELELFIMDCHALSKDGIISKSEEIVMKRKIYKSLRWLLKQLLKLLWNMACVRLKFS
mgnify:CR=1 FL=1